MHRVHPPSLSSSSSSLEGDDDPDGLFTIEDSPSLEPRPVSKKNALRIAWCIIAVMVTILGVGFIIMACVVLRATHMSEDSIGADCVAGKWEVGPCPSDDDPDGCFLLQTTCDLTLSGQLSPPVPLPSLNLHLCKDKKRSIINNDCVMEARERYRFLLDPCFYRVPEAGHYLYDESVVQCHVFESLQSVLPYIERSLYQERMTFVIFNFSVGAGMIALPLLLVPLLRIRKHQRFML